MVQFWLHQCKNSALVSLVTNPLSVLSQVVFAIVASDGVWQFMSLLEVQEIVLAYGPSAAHAAAGAVAARARELGPHAPTARSRRCPRMSCARPRVLEPSWRCRS